MEFGDTRLTLLVRPNDLDPLGHVNNAVAVEYLEAGRWHWLGQHGLVPGDRVVSVVARCELDYRAEIGRGEVEVHTDLTSPDQYDEDGLTYRARFRQRIAQGAVTAVDALVTVAFLDSHQRCLVTLQDYVEASTPGKG
ncbi:acyl-CoA thioesterase [Kineosporia sp. J2-2]|uniref:Acyl-CoA thioesterase n=1 Tax=Kineosporia corallincola TaxID=2835133 RepID=A0ABS5TKM8_9ACTN|nr:acyl-CoA thioesterase [Kineosporia corallincola]MBT0770623.1 acyl-CoA thioesterase [Kineosporia corallincola]